MIYYRLVSLNISLSFFLRSAAIRAAIANNVWTRETAIGNERIQSATKTGIRAQVADGLRHDTRNGRFMQGKDSELEKVADSFGDGSSKEIVVQLQEFHFIIHSNVINAARELIIVQIKLRQGSETQEFRAQTTSQLIKIKILYEKTKESASCMRYIHFRTRRRRLFVLPPRMI